jgi:putative nucleotidyltransferase with HDIG domain
MAMATSAVLMDSGTEELTSLSSEDESVLKALFENGERYSECGDILRPISPLALQLLTLDEGSSTPSRDLARIIESDPILAARTLGLANSVAYAGSAKPIYKVGEAIVRLGVDTVLTAAFSQLAAQWMRGTCKLPDPVRMYKLWFEYLITAHTAREIAKRLPEGEVDPSLAYAAGLLHDVGTIALCSVQPEEMSRFLRAGYCVGTTVHAGFCTAHTRLGSQLLRSWNVPVAIVKVAARHHSTTVFAESAVAIAVFLADHLHAAVTSHDRAEFEHQDARAQGCYGPATESVSAALRALNLEEELDTIVARVASQTRGIEALAAASFA